MATKPIQIWRDLEPDDRTGFACIVDVETTGLSNADEAIELGLVLLFLLGLATAQRTVMGELLGLP